MDKQDEQKLAELGFEKQEDSFYHPALDRSFRFDKFDGHIIVDIFERGLVCGYESCQEDIRKLIGI